MMRKGIDRWILLKSHLWHNVLEFDVNQTVFLVVYSEMWHNFALAELLAFRLSAVHYIEPLPPCRRISSIDFLLIWVDTELGICSLPSRVGLFFFDPCELIQRKMKSYQGKILHRLSFIAQTSRNERMIIKTRWEFKCFIGLLLIHHYQWNWMRVIYFRSEKPCSKYLWIASTTLIIIDGQFRSKMTIFLRDFIPCGFT